MNIKVAATLGRAGAGLLWPFEIVYQLFMGLTAMIVFFASAGYCVRKMRLKRKTKTSVQED